MKALLVEDDVAVARVIRLMLEQEGFVVDVAASAQEGRTLAFVADHDVIILDLGLPDGSGLHVVQALRNASRTTPIMILTGAGDAETTVRALDMGSDDYLTKPIRSEEFRARVRALVRRGGAQRTESLVLRNVNMNRLTRQVVVGGKELVLTAKEFSLLEHLILNVRRVISRTELLEKLWETNFDPGTNVVDVSVSRLRKKLRDAGAEVFIEARRGVGFALEEDGA